MGDKKLSSIVVEDIGNYACGIFKRGSEVVGKTMSISGDQLTVAEMAAGFSKLVGQEVRYSSVSPDVYRGLGFPGAEDLGNMLQFPYNSARPNNSVPNG